MEINLIDSTCDLTSSKEKQILSSVSNDNIAIVEKLKKSMILLDKIELTLDLKVKKQISEIEDFKNRISENIEIFTSICKNIIT